MYMGLEKAVECVRGTMLMQNGKDSVRYEANETGERNIE